ADLVNEIPAGAEDDRLVPRVNVRRPYRKLGRQRIRRPGWRGGAERVHVTYRHQVADDVPRRALERFAANQIELGPELHRRDHVRIPNPRLDPELDVERVRRVVPADQLTILQVLRPEEFGDLFEVGPVRGAVDVWVEGEAVLHLPWPFVPAPAPKLQPVAPGYGVVREHGSNRELVRPLQLGDPLAFPCGLVDDTRSDAPCEKNRPDRPPIGREN